MIERKDNQRKEGKGMLRSVKSAEIFSKECIFKNRLLKFNVL